MCSSKRDFVFYLPKYNLNKAVYVRICFIFVRIHGGHMYISNTLTDSQIPTVKLFSAILLLDKCYKTCLRRVQ